MATTPKQKPTQSAKKSDTERAAKKAPKEDLVVFAFRLTEAEREAIHAAAGPGKASRFVRTLTTAAAKGDWEGVKRIVQAVEA